MTAQRLLSPSFLLLLLFYALVNLGSFTFMQLPAFLADDLGANNAQVGTVMAVLFGGAVLARPVIGPLMDRVGRRPVVLTGAALQLLVCALYLTVDSLGAWLLFVRCLHGCALACQHSAVFAIAADVVPKENRNLGIGLVGVAGTLTLALGPVVAGFVLRQGGFREFFHLNLGLAVLLLVVAAFVRESRSPSQAPGGPVARARTSFVGAVFTARLVSTWGVGFGYLLAMAGSMVFIKRLEPEFKGAAVVDAFFIAFGASVIVTRLALGWLADRVGTPRVLGPATLSVGIGAVALCFARTSGDVVFAAIAQGIGHGFAFPAVLALAISRSSVEDRGAVASAFSALFDLAILVSGPPLGIVADRFGVRGIFLASGLIGLAMPLIYVWADRKSIFRRQSSVS